jgi:hypothetical protein
MNTFKQKIPINIEDLKKLNQNTLNIIEGEIDKINRKEKNCMYIGGTLIFKIGNNLVCNDSILIDLDGSFSIQNDNNLKIVNGDISQETREKLFKIYLRSKGETDYYKEEYSKFLKVLRKSKINNIFLYDK